MDELIESIGLKKRLEEFYVNEEYYFSNKEKRSYTDYYEDGSIWRKCVDLSEDRPYYGCYCRIYDENGSLSMKSLHNQNKEKDSVDFRVIYDDNGVLESVQEKISKYEKDRDQKKVIYHKNGKIKIITQTTNLMIHGVCMGCYENGNTSFMYEYNKGNFINLCVDYYSNGNVKNKVFIGLCNKRYYKNNYIAHYRNTLFYKRKKMCFL